MHCSFLDLFTSGRVIQLQLHIHLGNLGQWRPLHSASVTEEALEMLRQALKSCGFLVC